MQGTDHVNWMLSAALGSLARAERMHQHFVKLLPPEGLHEPCWEPPVDVLETETEILILVALPGVAPDDVEAAIEGNALVIRGRRILPPELRDARIHRLELPQGCFERRIVLPPGGTQSPVFPAMAVSASVSTSRPEGEPMPDFEAAPADQSDTQRPILIPHDAVPIVPVRSTALFPGTLAPITLSAPSSVAAAQQAVREQRQIGVLLQQDPELGKAGSLPLWHDCECHPLPFRARRHTPRRLPRRAAHAGARFHSR